MKEDTLLMINGRNVKRRILYISNANIVTATFEICFTKIPIVFKQAVFSEFWPKVIVLNQRF